MCILCNTNPIAVVFQILNLKIKPKDDEPLVFGLDEK